MDSFLSHSFLYCVFCALCLCVYCGMLVAARVGNQSQFDYNVQRTNGVDGKVQHRGMFQYSVNIGLFSVV